MSEDNNKPSIDNNKDSITNIYNGNNPTILTQNGDDSCFVQHANVVNNETTNNFYLSDNTDKTPSDSLEKKLKIITTIVYILLIVIVLVFIIKLLLYDNYMNKAESYLSSLNYKEAVDYYQKAESCSSNTSQYVQAICREADCYITEATLNANNNNDRNKLLLQKALQKYGKIINNPKYKDTVFYYDALSGTSACYRLQNHPINDKKWKEYIEILENYLKDTSEEKMTYNYITQYARICLDLSLYYEYLTKTYSMLELLDDRESRVKQAYYHSLYAYFDNLSHKLDNTSDINDEIYKSTVSINNLLKSYSPELDKDHSKLNRIINSINNTINKANSNKESVEPRNIFLINLALGKAYYSMFITTEGDTHEEYRHKTYDVFSNLLSTPYSIAENEYPIVCYDLARTCLCNDEQLSTILSHYKEYVDNINISSNPQNYQGPLWGILSTCVYISLAYDNHAQFDTFAIELSKNLQQYISYFDNSYTSQIQNYCNYFLNNSGDISLDKELYNLSKLP